MRRCLRLSCVALCVTILSSVSSAAEQDSSQHWNQFRGPNGDGVSTSQNLPVEFDEAKNIRWKIAIPDSGWSSPVVWQNEIWLTTGSDAKEELRAICVDLETGQITKDIKVFDMIERKVETAYKHDSPHLNSPATPTSVVEENWVFVSFGSQGIACLDRNSGDVVWQRRDLRIYQPVRQGSSPIVDDKNLYVAFDGNFEQYFIALDKATGETCWKMDRNVGTVWSATLNAKGLSPKKLGGKPGDNKKSFATATLIEIDGRRQLIAPAAEATISYDPDMGEELWRVMYPGGFNVAARPIYANGLVYVFTSGLNKLLLAIKPDGSGDVTETHVAWSTARSTPSIPSPVIVNDLMFMVTDNGIARCLEAKTGEEVWQKRLRGEHWASPLYVDGKLYFSSKQGDVTVLAASGTEPMVMARNEMNATFIASPAVAGSSLILRSTTHLYCVANSYHRTPEQVAADIYPEQRGSQRGTATVAPNGTEDKGLAALGAQLKEMVKAGKLTAKDAMELYQAAAGQ